MIDFGAEICSSSDSVWAVDPGDIMQDMRRSADLMLSIAGEAFKKQAVVLTDAQYEAMKAIIPLSQADSAPLFGGIEVHHRPTAEECRALTTELRFQGYEVTRIDHTEGPPAEAIWQVFPEIAPPPFSCLNDYTRQLGVPAHILNGDSGSNYAAARQDYERFFGPPAKQPQAQAEEDY